MHLGHIAVEFSANKKPGILIAKLLQVQCKYISEEWDS